MPFRDDSLNPSFEHALAQSLRALPDAGPLPDLWPALAAAVRRRRRVRAWKIALPSALAAAIALAVWLPRPPVHEAPISAAYPRDALAADAWQAPAFPATAAAATPDELHGLHRRSQSLERWITAFAANAPQSARELMAAVEVEDLIGLIDLQLGATRDDADALPLWRQRVALLEDLATIRGSAFAIAANDAGALGAASPTSPLLN